MRWKYVALLFHRSSPYAHVSPYYVTRTWPVQSTLSLSNAAAESSRRVRRASTSVVGVRCQRYDSLCINKHFLTNRVITQMLTVPSGTPVYNINSVHVGWTSWPNTYTSQFSQRYTKCNN